MELPNKLTPTEPVKFSESETTELTEIRDSYGRLTNALGQLEMQKRELRKTEGRINDDIEKVEVREKAFLDRIVAKYGEGTFDINTGIFTPRKV